MRCAHSVTSPRSTTGPSIRSTRPAPRASVRLLSHAPAPTWSSTAGVITASACPAPISPGSLAPPTPARSPQESVARVGADAVARWYGPARRGGWHYAEALHAGQTARADAENELLRAVQDSAIPPIARASALALLPRYAGPNSLRAVKASLGDPIPWSAGLPRGRSRRRAGRRVALGRALPRRCNYPQRAIRGAIRVARHAAPRLHVGPAGCARSGHCAVSRGAGGSTPIAPRGT